MSLDAPVSTRRLKVTIAALLLAQFIAVVNGNAVISAIPRLQVELHSTSLQSSWLLIAGLLGMTVSTPIWGRLADGINPVVLLRIAVSVFIVTAFAAAFAPSMFVLILVRVAQGLMVGGCFILPFVAIANVVPPRERGRYLGGMTAVQLVGTLGGPFIGGLVVQTTFGWHAVMLITVPIAVAVLVLLGFSTKLGERPGLGHIDYAGAALLSISVSAILVWISFTGSAYELISLPSLLLGPGGLALFAVALIVEARAQNPILPVRLICGRVPILAAIAMAGSGMTGLALALLMSLFFQFGHELPPAAAGVLIVSSAVGSVVSAFVVGARTRRTGRLRRYLVVGTILTAMGSAAFALTGSTAALPIIVLMLLVFGGGQGVTMQFTVLAAQNAVGLKDVGAVSGFMNFIQFLGGTAVLSLYGAMLNRRVVELEGNSLSISEAYLQAVPELFYLATGFAVVSLIAVSLLPSIRLRTTIDEDRAESPEAEAAEAESAAAQVSAPVYNLDGGVTDASHSDSSRADSPAGSREYG